MFSEFNSNSAKKNYLMDPKLNIFEKKGMNCVCTMRFAALNKSSNNVQNNRSTSILHFSLCDTTVQI